MSEINVLFLSYNGLLEPILESQAVPCLERLTERGFRFILLTYEKKRDLEHAGAKEIRAIKDRLYSGGIEWRYLRYHKSPRIFATLFDIFSGALYSLYLIAARRVSIVHVRGITPGTIMILISGFVRARILFDMRGRLAEEMAAGGLWEEGSLTFRLIKLAEKRLLETADAVTVLTKRHFELNRSLDYLNKRDIPKDIIPCSVDMERFGYNTKDAADFRKGLGLDSRFVLMYPGKIGTFYFMEHMLDFYKTALDDIPDAVFVVLTTDETEEFRAKADSLGIRHDSLVIVRNVAYADMPRHLEIADAGIFFINPYNKMGSSPIKMGEFLACGVPVIINPGIGDTEDLVRENRVGVVVENMDKEHYRSALKALLELKKEGDALKLRCRDTARRRLSLDDAVAKYADIYKILRGSGQ